MFIVRAIVWLIDHLYLWLIAPFRKKKIKLLVEPIKIPQKTKWYIYWKFKYYKTIYCSGSLELDEAIHMGTKLNQDRAICAWLSTKDQLDANNPNVSWFKENNNGQFY